MAVFLTKNSQPQRTSPVKRGFWVVHKISGRTHSAAARRRGRAARQGDRHRRQDDPPVAGAAHRGRDVCPLPSAVRPGRPVDGGLRPDRPEPHARTWRAGRSTMSCGCRPAKRRAACPSSCNYLRANRNDDFTKTLCHKFLGYALGRSLELSDQPLLEKMQAELRRNDYRFATLFETVVCSPQFRNQRCRDFTIARFRAESHRRLKAMNADRNLSRRVLLKGLGLSVALPWLESAHLWGGEFDAGPARRPPQRFACMFIGDGISPPHWWAKGDGADMELGREPRSRSRRYKEKLNVINGLFNQTGRRRPRPLHRQHPLRRRAAARPHDPRRRQHGPEAGQALRRRDGPAEPGARLRAAGQRLPREPVLDGLRLAHLVAKPELADPDRAVSVAGVRQPVRQPGRQAAREHPRRRARAGQRPARQVSGSDQVKIDEYLTSVRETEQRVQKLNKQASEDDGKPRPTKPAAAGGPAEGLPRVRPADVRHHRPGVPDRPHADRHAADVARSVGPGLSVPRHPRRPPQLLARQHGPGVPGDRQVPRRAVRLPGRSPGEDAGRATARSSTTRASCSSPNTGTPTTATRCRWSWPAASAARSRPAARSTT